MEKALGIFSFTAKKKKVQKKTLSSRCTTAKLSLLPSRKLCPPQMMLLYLLGPAIFAYDLLISRSLTDQTCVMAVYMSNRFFSFQVLIEATIKEEYFS